MGGDGIAIAPFVTDIPQIGDPAFLEHAPHPLLLLHLALLLLLLLTLLALLSPPVTRLLATRHPTTVPIGGLWSDVRFCYLEIDF